MLAAVATSCGAVAQRAKHVTINESAIDKFLDSLSPETLSSDYAIMAIPLKFPRIEEEINFVCVLDLLNFGSGYRKELHLAGDRGAFETMLFGTMSMYLHHGSLSASVLTKLTLGDVAEEKATHLPGVYTNAPTKLTPLAKAIVSTMNETGATLLKLGYADFASFVIDTLSKAPDHRADRLVERLMSSFPAFDDRAKHTGEEVIIAKKAQLLASDLSRRLKDRKPEFSYGDSAAFTVFADNVLPCMLRHLGILELTPALAARIDAGELLPPGEEETELRAVSVAACARVVQRAATMDKFRNAPVTAPKLDYYLWKEAKAGTNRALHRHATQDTVYY